MVTLYDKNMAWKSNLAVDLNLWLDLCAIILFYHSTIIQGVNSLLAFYYSFYSNSFKLMLTEHIYLLFEKFNSF